MATDSPLVSLNIDARVRSTEANFAECVYFSVCTKLFLLCLKLDKSEFQLAQLVSKVTLELRISTEMSCLHKIQVKKSSSSVKTEKVKDHRKKELNAISPTWLCYTDSSDHFLIFSNFRGYFLKKILSFGHFNIMRNLLHF